MVKPTEIPWVLQKLLDSVPDMKSSFFDPQQVDALTHMVAIDKAVQVSIVKNGSSKATPPNIPYQIRIMGPTAREQDVVYTLWVVEPHSDPAVNRRAVMGGISRLLRDPNRVMAQETAGNYVK